MKILFLQKRLLFPADRGPKIRTLNIVRHLARWHDVTYLCNVTREEVPFVPRMRELRVNLETIFWNEAPRHSVRFYRDLAINQFSRDPFNVVKDYDPALRRRAKQLLEQQDFDLLICDFVQMARNAIGLPARRSLLFQHNVESEVFASQAEFGNRLRRQCMAMQARKMARFESTAGRRFDTVVAVSRQDRDTFQTRYGWSHVEVIDTAVDLDYFQPQPDQEQAGEVLFVGSLDWPPNQDGLEHFVQDVWPHVRAACPNAVFRIVGRNPDSAVQRLDAAEGVEVIGTVEDVRPHLARAQVVVVPIRAGSGTRLKIYEALAMKKAVVSTSLGAEGLQLSDGTHLLLADAPQDFANRIAELLQDDHRRQQLAGDAYQLVKNQYGAEHVARQFEKICQNTIQSDPPTARQGLDSEQRSVHVEA